MTEQQTMLVEMVDRLFKETMSSETMSSGMPESAATDSQDPHWNTLDELGLCNIFCAEADGGFGGGWQEAFIVFNLLGYYALPLPVGETIVSKKLLLEADIPPPNGALAFGICQNAALNKDEASGNYLLSGELSALPWGAYASHIVVACKLENEDHLILLPTDALNCITSFTNEAGEPRCDISLNNAVVTQQNKLSAAVDKIMQYGALLRSSQISGALESALDLTIAHVNERVQFGRPLSKFQVIQHSLALLAEEAAAVSCAAKAACYRADIDDPSFEIAATKLRANRSISKATSIAHQAHGAIGFTKEHSLHFFTQRLWSWRTEFGNDRYWANYLGRKVLSEGAENFWNNLTARSDCQ